MAWLRCVEANIAGPDGIPELPKSDPAWDCIAKGWKWIVLAPEVEDSIPTLPSWTQMALNSGNSIGKAIGELEVACLMTHFFNQGLDLSQACLNASQGDQRCKESIPFIAIYVQKFAGGAPNFPIINFLSRFSQQFNATLLMGQDFFQGLTMLDFKQPDCVYPFIRASAWATMLTTSKSSDGYAKLLHCHDLDKLKSNNIFPKVQLAEKMLTDSWKTIQNCLKDRSHSESHTNKCFGRMAVRTMLFLTGKQKFSREGKEFESLESILEAFTEDMKNPNEKNTGSQGREELPVTDVVNAKPKELVLLQNSHIQIDGLCLGCLIFLNFEHCAC